MREVHPYARLFPEMRRVEQAALRDDIKKNGLQTPITTFKGKILDGVNRAKACSKLGIRPWYEAFKGTEEEALSFVLSQNLRRRHLTAGQKAMLALELEKEFAEQGRAAMAEGGKNKGKGRSIKNDRAKPWEKTSAGRAAFMVGVSRTYVIRAKGLCKRHPGLADSVRSGVLNLDDAAKALAIGRSDPGVYEDLLEGTITIKEARVAAKKVAKRGDAETNATEEALKALRQFHDQMQQTLFFANNGRVKAKDSDGLVDKLDEVVKIMDQLRTVLTQNQTRKPVTKKKAA